VAVVVSGQASANNGSRQKASSTMRPCLAPLDTTGLLLDDLRIARILRGTRPVLLTVRKRPEFFFQVEVLFARFG
jgi:hypothetical protein